ncbi:hypothetical protein ACJMK2_031213 [Sinanodonta woodiana]|uniref:Mitochondria-eating protein C-terminal domain-containing protein n=1 Tax=Sinanodonta woodiana TaxID=1069815 RepID=A0ABD3WY34_SINWO
MEETGAILKDVSARKYNNLHYDRLRKARKELTWALSEVRVKKSDVNSIEELLNIIWSFFEDTSNKSTRLRLHIQVEHAMQAYESLKEDLNRYKEKQATKVLKGPTNSPTTKTTVFSMPGLSWESARNEPNRFAGTYKFSQDHVGNTKRESNNTVVKRTVEVATRNSDDIYVRLNGGEENMSKEISQGHERKTAEVKREKHVNFSDTLYVSSILSTHLPSLRNENRSKYTNDFQSGTYHRIDKNKQNDHADVTETKNAKETSTATRDGTLLSSLGDSNKNNQVSSDKGTTVISGSKLIAQNKEPMTVALEDLSAERLPDSVDESDVHDDKVKRLSIIRPEVANLKKEFSQLYQRQWMDAFVELSEKVPSEEEIISTLLNIVMYAYQYCEKTATRQMKNLEAAFKREILFPNDSKVITQVNYEKANSLDSLSNALVTLRNLRQEVAHTSLPAIIPMVVGHIEKTNVSPVNQGSRLYQYIEKCVELTWLMCIQDAPMFLYICEPGTAHQDKFRSYTRSGPIVKYCVWPCLYLHAGGSLLDEGIAQMQ